MRASTWVAAMLCLGIAARPVVADAQNIPGTAPAVESNGSASDRERRDDRHEAARFRLGPAASSAAATELRIALDAELRSIDWASRHATRLYITGTVLFFAGGGVTAAGIVLEMASAFSDSGAPRALAFTLAGLGAAMGVASLIMLGCAIGFDVDSGSRRAAHERRRAAPAISTVRFTPTVGGLSVALGVRF